MNSIIDIAPYIEERLAAKQADEAARQADIVSQVRLEWVLADLMADLEAA